MWYRNNLTKQDMLREQSVKTGIYVSYYGLDEKERAGVDPCLLLLNISGYASMLASTMPQGDPDEIFSGGSEKDIKKIEEKAISDIRKHYSEYLKNLEEGGIELNALLHNSGYTSKKGIIEAWERKGPGAIDLRFSQHNESDILPDHGHERTGAPTNQDQYYLHPDGNNSLDGAYATGNGIADAGGTIVLARAFLNFQRILNMRNWYSPPEQDPDKPKEDFTFDYKKMEAEAYTFLCRIISHEMTHVGADVHKMPAAVAGLPGAYPSWVKADEIFTEDGVQKIKYHRGDVFEYEAYGSEVTYKDYQYGFAVNAYFRTLARMSCSVAKKKVLDPDTSGDLTREELNKYIKSDKDLERLFKPDKKYNKGDWHIMEQIDLNH